MSNDLPAYRAFVVSTTKQTQAVKEALREGQDGRLFMLRMPDRKTLGNEPLGSSIENALILECMGYDDGSAMDALRQLVKHSPLLFFVDSPTDIEAAGIEDGDASSGKALQDYFADRADHGPSSQCVISSCNDCEHYKQLAKENESARAKGECLRAISEMLREGILVVDTDGVIRYVNPATCELFQRPAEQLIGYPFGYPVSDSDSEITLLRPGGKSNCLRRGKIENSAGKVFHGIQFILSGFPKDCRDKGPANRESR